MQGNPQPAERQDPISSQPELIGDDPRQAYARKPDPDAKPTWKEWYEWDVWRRLLNDCRLRKKDAAFKLWHWLHNCKDTFGETGGFRTEAWYIARKHGWKPATVYAMIQLLSDCGYLTWRVAAHCHHVYRVFIGKPKLPKDGAQQDLPFIMPAASAKTAPTGTTESAKTAPAGTTESAKTAPSGAKTAPRGTPYTMCELSVTQESVNEGSPPFVKREHWQIEKQLGRVREMIKELTGAKPARHDPETTAKIVKSLRLKEGNLEREFAGLPAETSEEKAVRLQAAKPTPTAEPVPPVPLTEEKKKELLDAIRREIDGK